jgi:hypothetical protein
MKDCTLALVLLASCGIACSSKQSSRDDAADVGAGGTDGSDSGSTGGAQSASAGGAQNAEPGNPSYGVDLTFCWTVDGTPPNGATCELHRVTHVEVDAEPIGEYDDIDCETRNADNEVNGCVGLYGFRADSYPSLMAGDFSYVVTATMVEKGASSEVTPRTEPFEATGTFEVKDNRYTASVTIDFPSSSFIEMPVMVCSEGTCEDPRSGLTWEDPPSSETRSWSEARSYCQGLGSGWHMPGPDEIRSLALGCPDLDDTCSLSNTCLETSCGNYCPECDELAGPGKNGCYWDPALDGACKNDGVLAEQPEGYYWVDAIAETPLGGADSGLCWYWDFATGAPGYSAASAAKLVRCVK